MRKFFNKFIHKLDFNIFYLLFSALIFRLFIANFGILDLDQGTFIAWAKNLSENGFGTFYDSWSDYFPGYLYVLYLLGKINSILPELQTILFKLPAIFADLITGYLIYKVILNIGKEKTAIIVSSLYLFNPAVFANSSLWGQVDSLTALFSVLSLFVFSKSYLLSSIFLSVGTLIKPQAAFVLPAFFYLMSKNKFNFKKFLTFGLSAFSIFIFGFLPFNNRPNFLEFILERFSVSSGQYPYGSVNAFSFWGFFGFWKPDNFILWIGLTISLILIILITIIILKKKTINGEYLISGFSFLVTFLFMTRMHERHLLPSLAPLLIYASTNSLALISYFLLSLTYLANLSYAYQWITYNFKEIFNLTMIRIFIAVNISTLVLMIISLFKNIKIKFVKFAKGDIQNFSFKTKDVSKKKAMLLLSAVFLFGFLTRFYGLNKPENMYFDEVYHAFTAKLVYQNDPKAWEWWNPHPEGFAYEWTHPPLSKLGMALGMIIFGNNSFGWRAPQAILGSLCVLLIYFLVKEIFKDRLTAILASLVFTLEGLPLVLSRMGMNDIYLLFFLILSFLLFLKDKSFFSALAFGLALSSKWSAIYAIPVFIVSFFVFKKKFRVSYLSFLVIPILIYISSYFLMFKTGHSWDQFIEVQKQMWWYHTNLDADHPYTSPAWTWPLNIRPVYLYDGQVDGNGKVARIYAFGNPTVLWFGLFSIILSIFISKKEKNKKLGFLIFSYLIFFLPWLASPRIMFFYHYLPSIPFLAIIAGYILRRLEKIRFIFLALAFITFIYFYPHWTGVRIPIKLDESYYWFSSWR